VIAEHVAGSDREERVVAQRRPAVGDGPADRDDDREDGKADRREVETASEGRELRPRPVVDGPRIGGAESSVGTASYARERRGEVHRNGREVGRP